MFNLFYQPTARFIRNNLTRKCGVFPFENLDKANEFMNEYFPIFWQLVMRMKYPIHHPNLKMSNKLFSIKTPPSDNSTIGQ